MSVALPADAYDHAKARAGELRAAAVASFFATLRRALRRFVHPS